MSTSVASVTKHFPSAENGFTTTTSGSVSSGAATVGLNSVAGFANGEVAVFVIDPTDAVKKQTFTGTIDTAGVQVTGVVWTAGTNQTHALGATVVDYATATHISMISKGLLVEHNQTGTHSNVTATSVTATTGTFTNLTVTGTAVTAGWSAFGDVPDTITYNGNRSYSIVYNGVDHTSTLSNGMRKQFTRTVSAPTQCTDLESGSSQYYSKTSPTGLSFTDDFTCMAWIKLESYGAVSGIIGRRNADTEGFSFQIEGDGAVQLSCLRIAANNAVVKSYQSVPLGRWVHVAASYDLSGTTAAVYIDGVEVPSLKTVTGTCTAIVQGTTALTVGAQKSAGTNPFDGKLAQVAVFSSVLSAATIASYASQTLSGSESTLVSAYSFNNSINDLSATANNLTPQGSAVATAADSPFAQDDAGVPTGTTDCGIVQSCTFSTNTTVVVQVPEGCTIPTSGGVSSVAYSTQKNPFGFPVNINRWFVEAISRTDTNNGASTVDTYYNVGSLRVVKPSGSFLLKAIITGQATTASSAHGVAVAIGTSAGNSYDIVKGVGTYALTTDARATLYLEASVDTDAQTTYYINIATTGSAANATALYMVGAGNFSTNRFYIIPANL